MEPVPRWVRAGLAALVVVAGAPVPAAGSGPTTSDPAKQKTHVDRERNRLAERYDETLAAEADLVAAYERSRATAADLARQLVVIDGYSAAVQRDLDTATTAAAKAERRWDGLREDLRAAQVALARRRSELRATAVSGYVWFGERGTVHSAYGEAVAADVALVAGFYAGYLNDVQEVRVQAVERQEARVDDLTGAAQDASSRAKAAQQKVAARRADLQKARDERAAAKAKADVEVEHQRQLVAEVEAKRADYERRLQSLQVESQRLGDLLRARQTAPAVAPRPARPPSRSSGSSSPPTAAPATTAKPRPTAPPPGGSGNGGTSAPVTTRPQSSTTNNAGSGPPPKIAVQLSYPLPGYPVVSTYGWRIHPILGVRKLHEGIDIWAPEGTPIHAAAAGVVIWAGPRNGYGNAVIIDHGSGVGTVYAHQSKVGVSPGQSVSRGAVIGYVGHTGLAAGPHLHFEVRVGGRTYDPLAYVHPS
jgi:murein DD-endopeptidase MepM/ murein hydrolase activator NlpD